MHLLFGFCHVRSVSPRLLWAFNVSILGSTDIFVGRVNTRGSTLRAHLNNNLKPLTPQQVLFARTGAPTIYAEKTDEYNYAKSAPPGSIPDGDLLKALHTYASDFYARMPDPRFKDRRRRGDGEESFEAMKARLKGCRDFRSMDETALIAMGVLMEEMIKESLGETGDLAFVEEGETSRKIEKRKRAEPATIALPDDVEAEADDEEDKEREMDVDLATRPEVATDDSREEKETRRRKGRRKSSDRRSRRQST